MEKLFLVMPAYNEEENIEAVIDAWYPVLEKGGVESRLIVADSGSTDNTHEILVGLQQKYDKLQIISDTEKQHGPKLMALYDYAVQSGADYIFQTDSDGQTDAAEFAAFWDMRKQFDAIFGNRQNRKDGKWRVFVEHVVCILLRLCFGVKVPDANAPFRLMKTEVMKKYLYRLPMNYELPNIMLTAYFVNYKERVAVHAITFENRRGGGKFSQYS